jgi:DNA-binding NarL/FixJ family response regulator
MPFRGAMSPTLHRLGPVTVRVLVIDDQPQLRTLVRRFFSIGEEELEIVGEAASAAEAVELAAATAADVAVVDANLPDRSGVELARELRAAHPALRVVLFTGHVDPGTRQEAEDAGVDAIVLKDDVADLGRRVAAVMGR